MKILKKILVVLAIIIALPFIIALFVPNKYTVSEKIIINKPKQEVYDYVRILKNQEQYSEWVKADSNLQPTITGIDGEVGAMQSWNSKDDNVGEGNQKIVLITADRIDVDLTFIRPFAGKAKAANLFKAISENQTELTSEFYGDDKYPFNLMGYFFGTKIIQETEIKNLNNIKTILEKK